MFLDLEYKKSSSVLVSLRDRLGRTLLNKFDMYILLSEEMKNVIDIEKKSYIIIEGIYDFSKKKEIEYGVDSFSDNQFNIVYAGSLYYEYGIMNLVNAVELLNYADIELLIFGSGEAEKEIKKIAENNKRIVFGGLVPRDCVLEYERKASLLVNPRPVEDEYVKYSFPSKNMEYMASGTPVLLTNIPSLPDEYKKYVILADTNDVDVLKTKIEYIYSNQKKFSDLGEKAQKFILREKNKKKQSLKLIELIGYEN